MLSFVDPKEGGEGCTWNQSEEGQNQCQVLQTQDLQTTKVNTLLRIYQTNVSSV